MTKRRLKGRANKNKIEGSLSLIGKVSPLKPWIFPKKGGGPYLTGIPSFFKVDDPLPMEVVPAMIPRLSSRGWRNILLIAPRPGGPKGYGSLN